MFKHYKGHIYRYLFPALHSESQEELVVYRGVEDFKNWVRPRVMFHEKVEVDGVLVPRFKELANFMCKDCNGHADTYMVHDDVWAKAVPEDPKTGGVYICIKCMELRLKRPLSIVDFGNWPVNEPIRFGFELALRGK